MMKRLRLSVFLIGFAMLLTLLFQSECSNKEEPTDAATPKIEAVVATATLAPTPEPPTEIGIWSHTWIEDMPVFGPKSNTVTFDIRAGGQAVQTLTGERGVDMEEVR